MKGMRLSDYQALRFEEPIPKMDVVFDTVGGETLQRSWGVLKPGGRMITIAADSEATTDDRVKQAFFIVEPNREQLSRIGHMLDVGDLRMVVDAVLPLTQATVAYTGGAVQRRAAARSSLLSQRREVLSEKINLSFVRSPSMRPSGGCGFWRR